MRRLSSRWRWTIGIVVLVVVVFAAAVVAPAIRQPYADSPAYKQTIENLQAAAAKSEIASGPLRVGFGEASLTPDLSGKNDDWRQGRFPGLPLAGFSSRRGVGATGVKDPLWVKSIAVEVGGQRVVLTALDALMVPPGVTELLKPVLASNGLSRSQLYLAATHTHSGPGGWGHGYAYELSAGPLRDGVERWFAQQIDKSIADAIADLKPGEVGEAWVDIPDMASNRTAKDGPPHGGFPVLAFRQDGGSRIVLGAYAAHPTVIEAKNLELSGDYPGAWQRTMERSGFDHAVFMAGPVGGQQAAGPARRHNNAEGYGSALAERLKPAIRDMTFARETALGSLGVDVVLPEMQFRFADNWRVRPWVARLVLPSTPATYFQAIRIGRMILVSTPADYAGELALPLEDKLRGDGLILAVTSFNGDYIGYIMPARYDHDDKYETRTMSFFGPGFGDFAADIVARLAAVLAGPPPVAGGQALDVDAQMLQDRAP